MNTPHIFDFTLAGLNLLELPNTAITPSALVKLIPLSEIQWFKQLACDLASGAEDSEAARRNAKYWINVGHKLDDVIEKEGGS